MRGPCSADIRETDAGGRMVGPLSEEPRSVSTRRSCWGRRAWCAAAAVLGLFCTSCVGPGNVGDASSQRTSGQTETRFYRMCSAHAEFAPEVAAELREGRGLSGRVPEFLLARDLSTLLAGEWLDQSFSSERALCEWMIRTGDRHGMTSFWVTGSPFGLVESGGTIESLRRPCERDERRPSHEDVSRIVLFRRTDGRMVQFVAVGVPIAR